MAVLKRHSNSLSRQIPDDVLQRARKAGVENVDWYAGRLDMAEDADNELCPPDERAELKRVAERRREERREDINAAAGDRMHVSAVLRRFKALLGRLSPRHAAR